MAKSKKIGEESHVYDLQGNLQGLWTIDGRKARQEFGNQRFWEGMDELIRLYGEINPLEMKAAYNENLNTKLNNKSKTGGGKTKTMREALNLPHGLYLVLIDYEPRIFRDKKLRTAFMKRYKNLRSVEEV